MRKLTKTLAVVSLLAPVESYPVGIGDIKLNSALNQNLNAEIILYLEDDESIEDFRVGMAPSEKFTEAGVPWTASLAKIKFEPIVKANGKAVIKLSSDETIQEPFLSFLVRVAWPQGTQYKEFTVLVDPPATYLQPVIPASTISTIAQAPTQRDTSEFRRPPSSTRSSSAGRVGATSDRVRVNDTLWKVAERANNGRNSTIEQMMIALYEANPKAFYQNNVNTLSAGAVLNIPNNDAVLKLSARQARAEFNRQNKAWRNRATTTTSTTDSAAIDNGDSSGQLKLIAPDETGVNQQASVAIENVETSPNNKEPAMAASGDAELVARLAELERKLAAMQVALAIKNEKLAALQARQMLPETGDTTDIESATQESILAPEQQQPEPKPEIVQQEITSEVVKPEVKPEVVKPATKTKPAPSKVAKSDSEDDSYYVWLVGIIALIGLLVGWIWRRKKIMEETISDESMFSSAFASSAQPGAEVSEISQMGSLPVSEDFSFQTGMVGENSILSEFTPSDFDAFETDQSEVDPISEADVYLAYGRYQQAEELMRKAIKDQPDRDECKLKLLEIFYANENAKEFESYANELAEQDKNQDVDFWGRVVEMGSEICPGVALFTGSTEEQTSTSVAGAIDETDSPVFTPAEEDATESLSFTNDSSAETTESNAIDFKSMSDDAQVDGDAIESFDFGADKASDSGAEVEDDVEFDFDMSFDSDEDGVTEDDNSQGDELIEMDELETKIDLARAYVDMGDEDAARTIAEEVLTKGNDAQKKEAQKIIDSL